MEDNKKHEGQEGITRRDFIIKTGVAAGVAVLAASTKPLIRPAYAAPGRRFIQAHVKDSLNGKTTFVVVAKDKEIDDTKGYRAKLDAYMNTTQVATAIGESTPTNPEMDTGWVGDQRFIIKRNDIKNGREVVFRLKRRNLDDSMAEFEGHVEVSELPFTPLFSGVATAKFI